MLPEILHASLFFSVNSYFFLDQAEPPPPSYLSERHPMLPGLCSPHCEEGGGGSECPRTYSMPITKHGLESISQNALAIDLSTFLAPSHNSSIQVLY